MAFRVKDARHHYLFAMNRQRGFRTLAVRDGDDYRVLALNHKGYESNRWHDVKVVLDGPRIAVYVDGQKDFDLVDRAFRSGTVALHSWGNQGSRFRLVAFRKK